MPCRGGIMNPLRLFAKIDSINDIGDLREDDDFLVGFRRLDLIGNEIKRHRPENDVIANRQNRQKQQRRDGGKQPGEQAVIMRKRVKPAAGGALRARGTGAEVEIG